MRLASRLTPRDRWLAAMVHEHRVLTGDQLAALAFPSGRAARARLRELWQWSVLDRFQPVLARGSAPMHYVLGPAGATVLAAAHGVNVKDLGYRRDRVLGLAHSLRLAHTVGRNQLLTTLTTHTHRHCDAELTAWWSENRCARHIGDLARPDAYAHWRTARCEIAFYLEYDTGTEALPKLTAKLPGYHDLARSSGHTLPLLIWLPSPRREAHARRALHQAWNRLDYPAHLPIATASPHPTLDPGGDVWLPLENTGPRRTLDRLPDAWPHLTHPDPDDEPPTPAGTTTLLPPPSPQAPNPSSGR